MEKLTVLWDNGAVVWIIHKGIKLLHISQTFKSIFIYFLGKNAKFIFLVLEAIV